MLIKSSSKLFGDFSHNFYKLILIFLYDLGHNNLLNQLFNVQRIFLNNSDD